MEDVVLTIVNLVLTLVTALLTRRSTREQEKATYMQFYEIVERHHSAEVTELRRAVMTELATKAQAARAEGKTLREFDPQFHLTVSALANYYEGLATFLKGGWNLFPAEAKDTMLEMLHNSVCKTWPLIDEYREEIYPQKSPERRPADWAGNYRWLHEQVIEYRTKNHDVAPAVTPEQLSKMNGAAV